MNAYVHFVHNVQMQRQHRYFLVGGWIIGQSDTSDSRNQKEMGHPDTRRPLDSSDVVVTQSPRLLAVALHHHLPRDFRLSPGSGAAFLATVILVFR